MYSVLLEKYNLSVHQLVPLGNNGDTDCMKNLTVSHTNQPKGK